MSARTRIRRLARILGIVAASLAGIVLVLALLLMLRPVREDALHRVLRVASDSLPGSIEVDDATWPSLSRLELHGVTWREDGDLLASADRIALDADLGALLRKDLHVRLLVLDGVEADVPRIRGAFPPATAPPADDDASGEPAFPRAGALPGVPSIAVDSVSIELTRLEAAEDVTLRARIVLGADLLAGHAPVLAVRALDATWQQQDWTITSPGVDLQVAEGTFGGRIDADLPPRAALRLDFETPGPREFRIVLAERDASGELLRIDGSFTQTDRGAIESVDYAFTLDAPELTRIEQALQRPGSLVSLSPLGRVRAQGEGGLRLDDPVGGELEIAVTADGIAARIDAGLRHEADWIGIEHLSAEADGLSLTAAGEYATGSYNGTIDADVEGARFLAGWPFAQDIPADLRAHLELEAGGEGSSLRPALLLAGSARSTGLDSLHVTGYGRIDGPDTDLRVDLRALVRDQLALAIDARAVDLERPRLHLAPILVRERLDQLPGELPGLPRSPNVALDPEAKSVAVAGLRVTGDLGELRLDAEVSEAEGGSGRLVIEWPQPPAVLGLAGFDAAARDTLLAPGWNRDGRPGIDARVRLRPGARSGDLDADVVLPAPWSMVAGLDSAAYDVPHLRGTARAEWDASQSWQAALDFAATAWLDSAFAHAHGERGTTWLDSLLVRGGPVRMTAAGQLDSTSVDAKFQLDLVAHPVLALLVPDLPPDLEFMANLRAGIAGSPKAPDARAKLLATARSPSLRLPLLSAEAEVVEGIPQSVVVDVPEQARFGGLGVRRVQLALRPENPADGVFPLWFAGDVQGDVHWAQVARIDSIGNSWEVVTDSLRIGAGGHVLRSVRPFTFTTSSDSTLRLDGLSLAGDPGTVAASFDLGPGRAQADVEVHLDASLPGALVRMPPRMLPTGYHLVARGDQDDLEASLQVEGINLGTRRDIVARVDSRRSGEEVEIEVLARDGLGRLAHGSVVLPMTVDLLGRRFDWHEGALTGSVDVDSLPLPYRIGRGDGLSSYLLGARNEAAPLADARLLFGGTGDQPVVGAQVGVGFPQVEKLRDDRLEISALWTGREGDAAALDLFPGEVLGRITEALPFGGIAVLGTLDRGPKRLAGFGAVFPLDENASSPIPGFGPSDPVNFGISAEPLQLDEWNSILPRGSELGGKLWLRAEGEGPIGDLPIEASVRMEKVYFRQSFGNAATLDGRIDVSGRTTAPVIRGNVTVPNALVRLPDQGRDLHPVQGESQLWALGLEPRDEFAVLDSLEVEWGWAFGEEDTTTVDEPVLTLAESTDLDVTIRIPNSFWIRGQGLQVQLAGDLQLELRNGVPTVVGELRALSGTLEVVGARLQLDRGVVTFYGGDTDNPALDLELSRAQGDVRVIVRVTGTAREPRLAFDSDPPMSQSDIMAYLLFGSSSDDLDGAQTQLLQDQAAAALSQFAAPMLENELTQSLGISMMQLQAGDDPEDGLSLVVGKYVTPQILLKYEQSLKDRQKYTVNAEYWLTRNLRIETRLSETRSTGIELNWSTDY